MILKIFKAVWFISVVAVVVNMLYVYAGMPEQLIVWEDQAYSVPMERDTLFYIGVAFLALVNVLVYVFGKRIMPDEHFRTWLHGLVITMNVFFVIAWSFIGLYNSSETFEYERAGRVITIGLILITVWVAAWPLFVLYRKFFAKPVV